MQYIDTATTVLLIVCYPFWEAYWRRGFGGLWNGKKIIESRGVQHIINVLITFTVCFLVSRLWLLSIYVAVVWQIEWTLSHGAVFDLGSDSKDDKRYDCWYCKYILDKMFPAEYHRTYWYDLFGLAIRYMYPLLLLIPVLGWKIMALGFVVAPVYALFYYLVREAHILKGAYSAYAEVTIGFIGGVILMASIY